VANFYFSDNDQRLAVLGTKKFMVMVVKTCKISFEHSYPKKYHFERQQSKTSLPESSYGSEYDASDYNVDDADDSSRDNTRQGYKQGDTLPSRKALLAGEADVQRWASGKIADSSPSDPSNNINNLRKNEYRPRATLRLRIGPEQKEKLEVPYLFPSDWTASICNTGKRLALYDKSQVLRNRKFEFKSNQEELILVYPISLTK